MLTNGTQVTIRGLALLLNPSRRTIGDGAAARHIVTICKLFRSRAAEGELF